MTEKKQVMSFEKLLAGTPLCAFLMELASITDEEIVEIETMAVQDGEIVLGEMTSFERRLNFWYDRRKAKLSADMKELYSKIQPHDNGSMDEMVKAIKKLAEFDRETDERFGLFSESITNRFPDAKGIALRAGYIIVANAKKERRMTGVSIEIVSGGSGEFHSILGDMGLFGILMSGGRRGGCCS